MNTQEKLNALITNLNPVQALVLPAIRWLLNPVGDFRSGRTHILAVSILEAAVRNPGCSIPIFDHHGPSDSRRVESTIKIMVEDVIDAEDDFVFTNGSLIYEPCER